jgi:hypothetical protein
MVKEREYELRIGVEFVVFGWFQYSFVGSIQSNRDGWIAGSHCCIAENSNVSGWQVKGWEGRNVRMMWKRECQEIRERECVCEKKRGERTVSNYFGLNGKRLQKSASSMSSISRRHQLLSPWIDCCRLISSASRDQRKTLLFRGKLRRSKRRQGNEERLNNVGCHERRKLHSLLP